MATIRQVMDYFEDFRDQYLKSFTNDETDWTHEFSPYQVLSWCWNWFANKFKELDAAHQEEIANAVTAGHKLALKWAAKCKDGLETLNAEDWENEVKALIKQLQQGEKSGFNLDEVEICKSCGTMKHVNSEGLCGRCVKPIPGTDRLQSAKLPNGELDLLNESLEADLELEADNG